MRIAITGASGFLGTALAGLLRAQGHEVLPVHHAATGPVYPDLPDADVLFHLGGSGGIAAADADPTGDLRAHARSTLELAEATRAGRFGRLVLASSAAVYGAVQGVVAEGTEPRPLSAYGVSKRAAELYALSFARRYGIDAVVARIGNPYGPGQRRLVVYDLAVRALAAADAGGPLTVRGSGQDVRDFLYVQDAARALQIVGTDASPGAVVNLGAGQPCTILALATTVAEAAGLPADRVQPDGAAEPGKVSTFVPDVQRLRALGFAPEVSLAEGVQTTVDWLRGTR
jgi:nucleoside-diphosphate-sugar epimerase